MDSFEESEQPNEQLPRGNSIDPDEGVFDEGPPPPATEEAAFYGGEEEVVQGSPNGEAVGGEDEGIFSADPVDGPVLPDPGLMREEGEAFREWRRQNAIYLEEKEKMEKEIRNQIINEAEEYKKSFYEKNVKNVEAQKNLNREREKLYHKNQEKFHKEADQQYWKAIAEIVPREVANIDKRRGKKEEEKKKTSIVVVQGPKPGKPTDLSRMRQLLLKLKQNPPPHMMPKNSEKDENDGKEGKDGNDGKDAKNGKASTQKGGKDTKNGKSPKADNKKDEGNSKAAGSPSASPAKNVTTG